MTRWIDGLCDAGEVCLEEGCAPLACTPGQPVCLHETSRGVCDESGTQALEPEPCEGHAVCRGGTCVDLCESAAERQSYIGCNYLAVGLPNDFLLIEARVTPHIGLVVANPEPHLPLAISVTTQSGQPATLTGSLDLRDNFSDSQATVRSTLDVSGRRTGLETGPVSALTLPGGAVATLILTPREMTGFETAVAPNALRLTSTRPVVAYQFNPLCCSFSYSNDASLLLPVEALDRDYTFLGAPDWDIGGRGMEYAPQGFTVAAAYDGTEVSVVLPEDAELQPVRANIDYRPEQRSLEATLDAGETLHVGSLSVPGARHQLDGALISATQAVSVFSDHVCTNIPHSRPACDHLEEQLIPRSTWGERYMLAPVARRSQVATEVTYWRVVAGEKGAVLTLGTQIRDLLTVPPFGGVIPDCRTQRETAGDAYDIVLGPGENCMLGTRYGTALTASEPVMVLGFLVGQKAAAAAAGSTETGDPAMFLLPPASQFRDSYTFLTPSTYAADFITLIAPASAVGGFTLDGQPLDPLGSGVSADRIGGSDHVALHVPVSDGVHRVEGTAPFGLLVYAYDQYVSYAYSGGLDLLKRR